MWHIIVEIEPTDLLTILLFPVLDEGKQLSEAV
jgi:hypothetical protein